jgi:hypothetical protein
VHGDAAARGKEQDERVTAPVRDEESTGCAESGEDQTFGEELLQETAAAGADGEADGHFVAAREGADEEQVAHVRAGDEQNENDDGEHYFEGGEQSAGVVKRRLP